MRPGRIRRAGSVAALVLLLAGCGSPNPPTQPAVASPSGNASSATSSIPPARSPGSSASGFAPPASAPACAISSLAATRASVRGSISAVTIGVELANLGAQPCSLDGSVSAARLVANDGMTVDRALPPSADAGPPPSVILPSTGNASAVLAFHWSNYCGPGTWGAARRDHPAADRGYGDGAPRRTPGSCLPQPERAVHVRVRRPVVARGWIAVQPGSRRSPPDVHSDGGLVETDRAFSDNSWITPLPSGVDPAMIRLARRGHRETEARDHIKSIRGLTGRFGRFSTRHAAFGPAIDGDRPNGRDRHPGVDTPLGRSKRLGPGASAARLARLS